jgi:hypothetical protein
MLELIATSNPNDPTSSQSWHHGFYAVADPSTLSTYPPTCDTCHLAHDQINPDVWYFYDSGDLRSQVAGGLLFIRKLSVYASGHQYDVVIGEVSLLGSNP